MLRAGGAVWGRDIGRGLVAGEKAPEGWTHQNAALPRAAVARFVAACFLKML